MGIGLSSSTRKDERESSTVPKIGQDVTDVKVVNSSPSLLTVYCRVQYDGDSQRKGKQER